MNEIKKKNEKVSKIILALGPSQADLSQSDFMFVGVKKYTMPQILLARVIGRDREKYSGGKQKFKNFLRWDELKLLKNKNFSLLGGVGGELEKNSSYGRRHWEIEFLEWCTNIVSPNPLRGLKL